MSLEELLTDPIEEFPVSKEVKIIAGKRLTKTASWLKAILLVQVGADKKQLRLYGWQLNKEKQWKVRQKFNISKGYAGKLANIFQLFSDS